MELKRAISRRGIFQRSKRQGKSKVGALEMAKRQGLVHEQTREINNNGVVRIRMVVKKSDLEKLMHFVNGGGHTDEEDDGYDDVSLPSLLEQRLKQLRRKHLHAKGISWSPALRIIPEEF